MQRSLLPLIIAMLTTITACGNDQATPEAAAAPSSAPTERGRSLFETNCASCHGKDGNLGLGGAEQLSASTLDSAAVAAVITNGRNTMPAFGTQLDAKAIEKIAGYVLRLRSADSRP